MTEISTWWMGLTLACMIVLTLAMCGMLISAVYVLTRANRLLSEVSSRGLPRAYALMDQAGTIGLKVENIARRIDEESVEVMPRVEQMLEKADQTMGMVEANTERVHGVIEGTSEGVQKVVAHPMTRSVLVSAGALAVAGMLRAPLRHYVGPNGRKQAAQP